MDNRTRFNKLVQITRQYCKVTFYHKIFNENYCDGLCNFLENKIYINPNISFLSKSCVIIHELGHLLHWHKFCGSINNVSCNIEELSLAYAHRYSVIRVEEYAWITGIKFTPRKLIPNNIIDCAITSQVYYKSQPRRIKKFTKILKDIIKVKHA